MKFIRLATMMMVVLGILCACGQQGNKPVGLNNSPVVAQRVVTPQGDEVVVVNMDLMTDTIDFPMSLLLSDLEIVKLDDRDEALIGIEPWATVSDNYVAVLSFQNGIKLFNKRGDFLTEISKLGQGPNEYTLSPVDMYIDESDNRFYFHTAADNKIFAFDLQGNPAKHIPLIIDSAKKTHFRVDTQQQLLYVAHMTFDANEPVYWIQDLDGNLIQQLPAGHLATFPDFSNELEASSNTTAVDYSIGYCYADRVDSLYHYDEATNRMIPVFTTNLDCISNYHSYKELPDYFLIFLNDYYHPETGWGFALIDKHTLKGSHIRLKFDMLGNIDLPRSSIWNRGYYKTCIHPYVLQEQWMQKGEIKGLPEGIARFVKYLQTHDVEDMNNVVLIGKLKQSKDEGFTLHDMNY